MPSCAVVTKSVVMSPPPKVQLDRPPHPGPLAVSDERHVLRIGFELGDTREVWSAGRRHQHIGLLDQRPFGQLLEQFDVIDAKEQIEPPRQDGVGMRRR